jgi:hypothetical protein
MGGGGLDGWTFALMFWLWFAAAGLTVWNVVRTWLWPVGRR